MKKFNKIMAVALAGVLAVGCNDLDTEPLGGTVTSEQKQAVLDGDPDMVQAGVYGLATATVNYMYNSNLYGKSLHNDFGYASMFLGMDSRGIDLMGPNDGYNWYSAHASLEDWGGTYFANLIFWNTTYSMIKSCNTVAATIDPETTLPDLAYYRAQAHAFRSHAYYLLVNMYQFTYAVNPDAPCVPVLTDDNLDEAAINGSPLATVAQVWDQVISDAEKAIELLDRAEQGGVTRPDKRFADQATMYGMLARAYLFTQKWSKAAEAAQQAINLAGAKGMTPYSKEEASVPCVYNLGERSFMWGIQNLANASYTSGVANWASMMGSWMPNGYNGVGCTRRISKKLYALIANTDVRKGWWMSENGEIPASLPTPYANYIKAQEGLGSEFKPYMTVKFAAADNTPGQTSGAIDVPMMRVEEMYLILAEAKGMTSASEGVAALENFVKTYRNSAYRCAATTSEELQEEAWVQRRIELWGEGFAFFDLMRLNKGINRIGCGFPAAWVFDVKPTDNVLHYQVTQDELESNPLLDKNMYNEGWTAPTPVADK